MSATTTKSRSTRSTRENTLPCYHRVVARGGHGPLSAVQRVPLDRIPSREKSRARRERPDRYLRFRSLDALGWRSAGTVAVVRDIGTGGHAVESWGEVVGFGETGQLGGGQCATTTHEQQRGGCKMVRQTCLNPLRHGFRSGQFARAASPDGLAESHAASSPDGSRVDSSEALGTSPRRLTGQFRSRIGDVLGFSLFSSEMVECQAGSPSPVEARRHFPREPTRLARLAFEWAEEEASHADPRKEDEIRDFRTRRGARW
jgi:hypothetical protein